VAAPARKLTNKEREALKTLPVQIKQLEAEHAALSEKMASAEYYQNKSSDMAGDAKRLEQLEADTMAAYEQFEALTGEV
jgi:ATP-binding cassette subfamily F protein uup